MLLHLENVSKHFHSKRNKLLVLDRINLKIEKGEFVCITGPSGCGKTTLLNIIAGLERATQGDVIMNGRKITSPGRDRAVIFQEPALFPWLSVIDNVEFAMKTAGVPPKERRIKAEKCLDMVNLSDFSHAYIHELSGGMKQRAALARALTMDSDVLLMDEPFAALDRRSKRLLQVEIQNIWYKTRKTVIFVTHNLEEAAFLADRVILMSGNPGRILSEFVSDLPRPRQPESAEQQKVTQRLIAQFEGVMGSYEEI